LASSRQCRLAGIAENGDGQRCAGVDMTAEQILKEIEALPNAERERLVQRMRESVSNHIPQDFIDALADFDNQRFVSMETALNEAPPGA
jgi:hypothetical protein